MKDTGTGTTVLLGLRSKGQRTDRQRTQCQITDEIKFPYILRSETSHILTSLHGPRSSFF
jgi:hypothetical protein